MTEGGSGAVTLVLALALVAALVVAVISSLIAFRARGASIDDAALDDLGDRWADAAQLQRHAIERLEREIRADIAQSARVGRDEQSVSLKRFGDTLNQQLA